MIILKTSILIVAYFVVYLSCGAQIQQNEQDSLPRTVQGQRTEPLDTTAILSMYREWSAALASRGSEGYVEYFIEGATLLPPNELPVAGKAAIRRWIEKQLAQYTIQPRRFGQRRISGSGDWAFAQFEISGELHPKHGGNVMSFDSKYLDILQRQEDGLWRFYARIWNSNIPTGSTKE